MSPVEEIGHEIVTSDLPCRFCEYNLRMLAGDGNCPECGNPVFETVRRSQLTTADPEWLRTVYDDVRTTLVTGIAAAFLVPAWWMSAVAGSPWSYVAVPCMIIGCIGMLLYLPSISGLVLHTSEVSRVRHRCWGWFLGYGTVVIVFGVPLSLLGMPWAWVPLVIGLVAAVVPLYPVFMAAAGETLARLTDDSGLVRLARIIRRNGIGLTVLTLFGCVLTVLPPPQRSSWRNVYEMILFALVVIILPLGHAVLSALSIILLYGLRGELRQAIQLAQLKHDLRERGDETDSVKQSP